MEKVRFFIGHRDTPIAYAWQPGSNACKILQYAEKQRGIPIRNLATERL